MAKIARKTTIEDITNGCSRECILKAIISRMFGDRDLEQYACIGLFKKDTERTEQRKYTWTEIISKWTKEGYAANFAKVYKKHKEDLRTRVIYKEVMKK